MLRRALLVVLGCSIAALGACSSTSTLKSPDGETAGIERPVDGDRVDWSETVRSGKVLNTYQTTTMNDDCKFLGYPKVVLTKQPMHGRFTFRRAPALPVVARSSRCYDTKIPHVLGRYVSDAGFTGND